jgi:hypothetical protein
LRARISNFALMGTRLMRWRDEVELTGRSS